MTSHLSTKWLEFGRPATTFSLITLQRMMTETPNIVYKPRLVCTLLMIYNFPSFIQTNKQTDRQTNKQTHKHTSLFYYYIDR